MVQRRCGKRGRHHRRKLHAVPASVARHAPGDAGDQSQCGGKQQGRPQHQYDLFRRHRADQRTQQQDQRGKRRVDQARPMHRRAGRRIEPMLRQVEPGLSGQELANLDQPHGVVGRHRVEHAAAQARNRERRGAGQAQQEHHKPVVCGAGPGLRRLDGSVHALPVPAEVSPWSL